MSMTIINRVSLDAHQVENQDEVSYVNATAWESSFVEPTGKEDFHVPSWTRPMVKQSRLPIEGHGIGLARPGRALMM